MAGLPKKRKLLSDVQRLSHSERTRTLAMLGRDHAGTKGLRKLLDSLDGDLYEWQLRLTMAKTAGESSDLIEGLRHPFRSVRSSAIHGLGYVSVDRAAFREALFSAAAADRRLLLAVIRKRRDNELADLLIEEVFGTFGAAEAAALIPACSPEQAKAWLPRLEHGVANWSSIARSHPDLFSDYLTERMGEAPISRDAWWGRAGSGIATLADRHPHLVLDLWENHAPPAILPHPIRQKLPRLASAAPDRTVGLLLRPELRSELRKNLRCVARRIARANDDTVAELAAAVAEDHAALASVLGRLAPSRRQGIFRQAMQGIDTAQLQIWKPLLSVLPHELRHAEARRMLDLDFYREQPAARWEILGSLPITEWWGELLAETHASDATVRGQAYRRLISATLEANNPEQFSDLLDHLQRLKNDQDPVRLPAMQALAVCPPHLVQRQHLGSITDLVRFVVEARDTSYGTTYALGAFLQRLLASASTEERKDLAPICVDAMALLASRRGTLDLGRLHQALPRGGEAILFEALSSRLQEDVKADRFDLLFGLTRALGPRGHRVPELQDLLETVTRTKRDQPARQAIQMWLEPRGTRTTRVAKVIDHDPSAALIEPVMRILSLGRQDLLDVAFSSKALTGRFASAQRRIVPVVESGFHRWSPQQREKYASLLSKAIVDEHTGHLQVMGIRTLSRIPEVGHSHLERALSSTDVNVVEAALAGLSWGEQPEESLDLLLSYAGGDRARVAVYAATRAARFAEPSKLVDSLRTLVESDSAKVTSRKEALRILGHSMAPGSLEVLANVWSQRPLHPDIGIALASALRHQPDAEVTWEVLEAMATGTADEALALVNAVSPLAWPARHRERLAALVTPLVAHENRHVSAAAWHDLARWRPYSGEVSTVIRGSIADLTVRSDWPNATAQLLRLVDGFPADPLLLNAVSDLVAQTEPPEFNAAPSRDLPVRQRLRALAAVDPQSVEARIVVGSTADHLVEAGYPGEALAFAMRSINWESPTVTLQAIAMLGTEHPSCWPQLFSVVSAGLGEWGHHGRWDPEELLGTATHLVESGSEPDSLVAAAVVAAAGPRSGWSQPWRQAVRELRQHPSPWVQDHANHILTAPE